MFGGAVLVADELHRFGPARNSFTCDLRGSGRNEPTVFPAPDSRITRGIPDLEHVVKLAGFCRACRVLHEVRIGEPNQ